jgi:hypothetical protein
MHNEAKSLRTATEKRLAAIESNVYVFVSAHFFMGILSRLQVCALTPAVSCVLSSFSSSTTARLAQASKLHESVKAALARRGADHLHAHAHALVSTLNAGAGAGAGAGEDSELSLALAAKLSDAPAAAAPAQCPLRALAADIAASVSTAEERAAAEASARAADLARDAALDADIAAARAEVERLTARATAARSAPSPTTLPVVDALVEALIADSSSVAPLDDEAVAACTDVRGILLALSWASTQRSSLEFAHLFLLCWL